MAKLINTIKPKESLLAVISNDVYESTNNNSKL